VVLSSWSHILNCFLFTNLCHILYAHIYVCNYLSHIKNSIKLKSFSYYTYMCNTDQSVSFKSIMFVPLWIIAKSQKSTSIYFFTVISRHYTYFFFFINAKRLGKKKISFGIYLEGFTFQIASQHQKMPWLCPSYSLMELEKKSYFVNI
jgi:hypothetical protein